MKLCVCVCVCVCVACVCVGEYGVCMPVCECVSEWVSGEVRCLFSRPPESPPPLLLSGSWYLNWVSKVKLVPFGG